MSVLIIDDNYQAERWVERVRALLGELGCPQVAVRSAADHAAARQYLNNPACDIRVVLLDQVFDLPGCRLLGEDLEDTAEGYPALQHQQGLLIARRIARDLGPLRPAVLMFTSQGGEIEQAADLCDRGVIDAYQGKPPDDPTAPETRSLRQLLCWEYRPALAVVESGLLTGIDPVCLTYLEQHADDWRRDTKAIVQTLAEVAHQETEGHLNLEAVRAARRSGRLPPLGAAWADDRFWAVLARRTFRQAEPWRFDGEPAAPRLRYFKVAGAGPGQQRVVVLLDPRAVPDLLPPERARLEEVAPTLQVGSDGWQLPVQLLFRLPLPARAPGGTLPYLLGAWFDVSPGDWVPLAALRAATLASDEPLRQSLADVFQAIDQGARTVGDTWNDCRPGWGPLADGVLINRDGRRPRALDHWQAPRFPLAGLRLHPDPDAAGGLPAGYDQLTIGRWLQALTAWFAFGRLPEPPARPIPQAFQQVGLLVRGQPVVIPAASWWGAAEPADPEAAVQRRGERLELARRFRCLGAAGSEPLRVRARLTLIDCELVCEADGDIVRPAFEQLHFEAPVELRDCRVRLCDGTSARFLVRHCVFAGGLTVHGLDAAGVDLRDCSLPDEAAQLRLSAVRKVPVTLRDLTGAGTIQVDNARPTDLRIQLQAVRLQVGPMVNSDKLDLRLCGGGAQLVRVAVRERLVVLLQDGAELIADRCRLAEADLQLGGPGARAEMRDLTVSGGLKLRGSTADGARVLLERAEAGGSVEAGGGLDLCCRRLRVARDLRCPDELARLDLQETEVAGSLDVKGCRVGGELSLRECLIGQVFRAERAEIGALRMLSTNCVGGMLFAGVRLRGELCIAQPTREPGHGGDDLTGVIFRDQLDFSGAVFDGPADFSHTVVSQEMKFQRARFAAAASFDAIQAGGNVVFTGAAFAGPVMFAGAIVQGVLDLRGARFAEPPDLSGVTVVRAVRLSDASWPARQGQPAAVLSHAAVAGLLDLATPRDANGGEHPAFWVDLEGASVGRLQLQEAAMRRAVDAGETAAGGDPEKQQRLARLARLYEAALQQEMRFDEADRYYRRARNLESSGGWARLKDFVWRHGTDPWVVLYRAMPLLGLIMAGYLALSGVVLGQGPGAAFGRLPAMLMSLVFVESPKVEGFPDWVGWGAGVLVLLGAILMNLFFAALVRKMLR